MQRILAATVPAANTAADLVYSTLALIDVSCCMQDGNLVAYQELAVLAGAQEVTPADLDQLANRQLHSRYFTY